MVAFDTSCIAAVVGAVVGRGVGGVGGLGGRWGVAGQGCGQGDTQMDSYHQAR